MTALERHVVETPTVPPMDVRALRERMRFTQRQFAGWFGFSIATLRHWERGNRKPAGAALVLLHVIRDNPRAVLRAVLNAREREPGRLASAQPYESMRAPPGLGDRRPPLRPRGPRRLTPPSPLGEGWREGQRRRGGGSL